MAALKSFIALAVSYFGTDKASRKEKENI